MGIFVTRDQRSLVPSGSIEKLLAGGGGRAIIPGTGAWEKKEAARVAAKAEADRKRIQELEDIRTRTREAGERALSQKQAIELDRLKRARRIQERKAWISLSRVERRNIIEEQRVRNILRDKPGATLDPRHEAARKRIQQRERFGRIKIETKKTEGIISKIKLRLLEGERKFAKTDVGKVVDVVSGGTLTERKLDRDRFNLNKDIEKFNKEFGGRELSEQNFNKAKRIEEEINEKDKKLRELREELANSAKAKIGRIIYGRFLTDEKAREQSIKGQDDRIEKFKSKLKSAKGLRADKLKLDISKAEKEKLRLEQGGEVFRVFAGTVPITPVGVPIPRNIKVGFLGTQKIKKGKIITDVFFKVGNKRIGIARGVTIAKGKTGVSVVLGKSGVKGIKFPSGKVVLGKKQVFVGIEKAISKPAKFARVLKKIKISKALRRQLKLPKTVNVIERNIKGFRQAGVGKVATVKGERFISTRIKFPSGKIIQEKVKGISVKDFASISRVLTKKDLSIIVGKAITSNHDKIHFIGLIKGTSKVGKGLKLTGVQQQQYKVALQKVASVVAAAAEKTSRVKGVTSIQKLALTQKFVQQIIKAKPILKPSITGKAVQVTKEVVKPKVGHKLTTIQISETKTRVRQKVTQISKESQKIIQKLKQVTKQKQKVRTKLAQESLQQQRQRLRLRLKTLTTQKQKLAKIKITPTFIPTPSQLRLFGIALPKRKKKVIKLKPKKRKAKSYQVYVRPLKKKGKKKPKLIRVTKRPIKKKRAKDLMTYLVDTSLSRTGRIKPSSKKPSKRKLKSPSGYASQTRKKFRTYKIVKGKRVPLRAGKKIEKSRYLLDTRQEKKQITLKKRIAQLKKQSRKPVRRVDRRSPVRRAPTRSPVRKSAGIRTPVSKQRKRKATPTQLKNLAKGRKALEEKRRRR